MRGVESGDVGAVDFLGSDPAKERGAEVAEQRMVRDGFKDFVFPIESVVGPEKCNLENGLSILERIAEHFTCLCLWKADPVVLSVEGTEGDVFF